MLDLVLAGLTGEYYQDTILTGSLYALARARPGDQVHRKLSSSQPRLWDNKHVFFENINHTYRCVFDDDFAKDNNGGEFNMLLSI